MIKIIKEGKKEFITTCPICGCRFSYEYEDLQLTITYKMVQCPCCGEEVIHDKKLSATNPKLNTEGTLSDPKPIDNMIYETEQAKELRRKLSQQIKGNYEIPCLSCPTFKKYMVGEAYVGDSPYQWCQYGGLKVTCTSTGTSINGVK